MVKRGLYPFSALTFSVLYLTLIHRVHIKENFSKETTMNITLSADQNLIKKSRQYAKKQGLSLNSMIRDFLKNISGENDRSASAQEFAQLAESGAGCSEPGYKFDRDEIHERGHRA